ncbi:MAG: hypothetical protein JHD23_08510 [Akkermansiaceae bacterium]|nr:hypothetical protein [Akkermansiaceae bacterium]MBJ7285504.1 hypothetical protein [Akkermansiaceae bacterium]MBJ7396347.1 hypothetical protein [Akkermansiaceae bacterium]MBJ7424520.1 hypothetical protein [Akkermansiaceae bacterium]
MKNLKFILLALVHLVFLANSAQAHYDPNIGRWLSRDPINEIAFWAINGDSDQLKDLITQKIVEKVKSSSDRNSQIASQKLLIKWLGGQLDTNQAAKSLGVMHGLDYAFVENVSINSTDTLGLDREIQGSGLHQLFVLEDWKDVGGKWVSTGATQWNFGPANYFLSVGSVALLAPVPGVVWTDSGGFENPFKSNPCQDIVAKANLSQAEARPPWYSFWGFNCRDFAEVHLDVGMNDENYKKCCNPDGTKWER